MENKIARFMRNTGLLRFLLPLGIIMIVFGFIAGGLKPAKYELTKGTVTSVREYTDVEDNETKTRYEAEFNYTVDGKQYTNSFEGLSEKPNVGDEIKVYYRPEDPQQVSNTSIGGFLGTIMLGLGAIVIVLAILSGVKAFKKSHELDEKIKTAAGTDKMPEIEALPKSMLTEYYVLYDGNMLKPGYKVEDKTRRVIYEGTMTKNALAGSRTFTFTNHLTGSSTEHAVGHTATATFNEELFSERSWFKFDGKNVWDVLHDRGIRIRTDILSKFPRLTYTVSLNGKFFATVETSSKNVHEEDEAAHTINIPVGRYFYRCWTNEADMDLLFLTVFAISETEQTVVE
ncbi:MAG: DUF3592 domain-containing protein [Lachnospiraceae bacterium]|nr:DUF3592 domain-containing protein [Lachnospiraceae bacterium]